MAASTASSYPPPGPPGHAGPGGPPPQQPGASPVLNGPMHNHHGPPMPGTSTIDTRLNTLLLIESHLSQICKCSCMNQTYITAHRSQRARNWFVSKITVVSQFSELRFSRLYLSGLPLLLAGRRQKCPYVQPILKILRKVELSETDRPKYYMVGLNP